LIIGTNHLIGLHGNVVISNQSNIVFGQFKNSSKYLMESE